MIRTIYRVALSFAAAALCGGLSAQTSGPGGPQSITAPRPLNDVANLLESAYGSPVTYEDPVREWRGDMAPIVSGIDERAPAAMIPMMRTLHLPVKVGPPEVPALDASLLVRILSSYHAENSDGPGFRVIASSYGLHIVPTDYSDAAGHRATVTPVLDTLITVPRQRRRPGEHIQAIAEALAARSGTDVEPFAFDMRFDENFAPNGVACRGGDVPPPGGWEVCSLEWGATQMSGREALISLFEKSSTTMTWRLLCQPSSEPRNRSCTLNLGALQVTVDGPDGSPVRRQLRYDRCTKCPPLEPPGFRSRPVVKR